MYLVFVLSNFHFVLAFASRSGMLPRLGAMAIYYQQIHTLDPVSPTSVAFPWRMDGKVEEGSQTTLQNQKVITGAGEGAEPAEQVEGSQTALQNQEMAAKTKEELTQLVRSFPDRAGPKPDTTSETPHRQMNQHAPKNFVWLDKLIDFMRVFPNVVVAESHIEKNPNAFFLHNTDRLKNTGNRENFITDNEFAHVHTQPNHSLHAAMPVEIAEEIVKKKWGEPHPLATKFSTCESGIIVMVYEPRNKQEYRQVMVFLTISYKFASGAWVDSQ